MCDCGRAGKSSAGPSGTSAQKNADGAVAVQFGACDARILNCLSIVKGWNFVRPYRPQSEMLYSRRDNPWKPVRGPYSD
jgi:hypothetical protein